MSSNPPLTLGIGCRRDATAEQIHAAVLAALGTHSLADVREVATLELKANEAGLVTFCKQHGLPLLTFTREQIRALHARVPTPSATALARFGIDGVCEPCALLARPEGRLVTTKIAHDGVTVAIAAQA
jgi:cobalamin biosynthesis protein CbiG